MPMLAEVAIPRKQYPFGYGADMYNGQGEGSEPGGLVAKGASFFSSPLSLRCYASSGATIPPATLLRGARPVPLRLLRQRRRREGPVRRRFASSASAAAAKLPPPPRCRYASSAVARSSSTADSTCPPPMPPLRLHRLRKEPVRRRYASSSAGATASSTVTRSPACRCSSSPGATASSRWHNTGSKGEKKER
ncbi:hypothetical protein [Oryza sativa Japonica Group]|uniref:Uncharacterized protein n=1 Tax=Oryza sativa subsp. japonica TaxID=39947 RepID=Q5ZBR7_ORYSJ|nr:hypothetical protein [Oryza sativa Japonica Group]